VIYFCQNLILFGVQETFLIISVKTVVQNIFMETVIVFFNRKFERTAFI